MKAAKKQLFTTSNKPKKSQVADTTWKETPKKRRSPKAVCYSWKYLLQNIQEAVYYIHWLVSELVLRAEPATQGCIRAIYYMKMQSAKGH